MRPYNLKFRCTRPGFPGRLRMLIGSAFLLLIWLVGLSGAHTSRAELIVHKVSGDMPDFGNISQYDLSPDGRYLVFCADREHDSMQDLFSVLLPDGEPVRLNAPLHSMGDVISFLISPDSRYVVYYADQEVDEVYELYSVPIQGGEAHKINGPLTVDGDVTGLVYMGDPDEYFTGYAASPDSQHVVYLADQDTNEQVELYCATITGRDQQKLSLPLAADRDVSDFKITPNSQGVVYSTGFIGMPQNLHSVYIAGGASVTLFNTPMHQVEINQYQITPNSLGVVFLADLQTDDVKELYSRWIAGNEDPVRLNPDLPAGGKVISFRIAPNSQRVVYTADQNVADRWELFSVQTIGGGLVRLNPEPEADSDDIRQFQITPNSQGVVYTVYSIADRRTPLYSVPIGGGDSNLINNTLAADEGVHSFRITPNSLGVVFTQGLRNHSYFDLYSAWITGEGEAIQLNVGLIEFDAINHDFQVSPDSQLVVFRGDVLGNGVMQLYGIPIMGGLPLRLNAQLVEGGNVSSFIISPDSQSVLYRADQEVDTQYELYRVFDQPQQYLYLPVVIQPE